MSESIPTLPPIKRGRPKSENSTKKSRTEYMRTYRKNNPEKMKEARQRYYKRHFVATQVIEV